MFACIYIPNFPVAAVLRVEPELRPRAIAIFEGSPPLEKICAVNEKSGRFGIAPGMTKAQAELCPEIVLRSGSALQESSAHAALLDSAQSFSPCVEDTACDTALLDLAGMESLLGSASEISRAIAHRISAFGLDANVAIAANPDAALIAARGFPGVTVILPHETADRLGPLPIAVLFADRLEGEERRAADQTLATLDRWGIRRLSALAALPQIALSERLGQEGLHLQRLALGSASRTLVPVEEPLIFEEAIELEDPVMLLEPLAFLLNRLLEQLCARLAARARSTQELRLTLGLELPQQSKFIRTLRLPLPMLDARTFLKLLQLDLNAHPPGAPIVKIHLAAEPARMRSAQGGLFLPPSPEPEKLELTLARIAGMVGEHKVGAIELLDTHHPEGFRMDRFAPGLPLKKPATEMSPPRENAVTALRRFRPPLHAEVTLENGQPVHLACRKEMRGDVLWRAGPWRFSGDWWEHDAWSRDEWDVALQNHALHNGESLALYRLVRDLLNGAWFVEGTYD